MSGSVRRARDLGVSHKRGPAGCERCRGVGKRREVRQDDCARCLGDGLHTCVACSGKGRQVVATVHIEAYEPDTRTLTSVRSDSVGPFHFVAAGNNLTVRRGRKARVRTLAAEDWCLLGGDSASDFLHTRNVSLAQRTRTTHNRIGSGHLSRSGISKSATCST